MLDIIAIHLDNLGICYNVIQGNIPPKKRNEYVEDFNTNPKGSEVMLVSLRAGGVGLNLIGGNHLFLLDLINPKFLVFSISLVISFFY
jgi:transcription termination factor 2